MGNNIFPLQSGVVNYTHTFGPTIINEFRAGVNYFPAEGNVQGGTTTNTAGLIPGQPTSFLPGLYFAGAHTMVSLGPGVRFISGTHHTAARLARSVARRARSGAGPVKPGAPAAPLATASAQVLV